MSEQTEDPTNSTREMVPRFQKHALALADDGYRVFPATRSKRPMIKGWQDKATTYADTIEAWGQEQPAANIGIATGEGLVVIDVDGPEGRVSRAELEARLGKLPPTRSVTTGRVDGGVHLYFHYPMNLTVRNKRLATHVDVRGEGGLVMAPGSVHQSGAEYVVLDDEPVADLPDRWLQELQARERASFAELPAGDVIPIGTQEQYINDRAIKRRNDGWDFEHIFAEMVADWRAGRLPNEPGHPKGDWTIQHFMDKATAICEDFERGTVITRGQGGRITPGTHPKLSDNKRKRPASTLRVNAQELVESDAPNVECLAVFGRSGIVVKGWAHLMSGQAKVGKSTLMRHLARGWLDSGFTILWFTEDPESAWRTLLRRDGGDWSGLTLVYTGWPEPEIRAEAASSPEKIVIVDTVRGFIPCNDENDAAQRAASIRPWVNEVAHGAGKTLILSVHARKSGGQHGEGIAGSHELLAAADSAIELNWPGADPMDKRRKLTTLGRVFEPVSMVYESTDDGLRDIGDSGSVERRDLENAILAIMKPGLRLTTSAISDTLEVDAPERRRLNRALIRLAQNRRIQRDPPIGQPAERRTVRWIGR